MDAEHLDAQPFLPTVAVAKDGTVGVLFYDFRYYEPGSPSLDTDVWLALYNKDLTKQLDEISITPVSFDTRQFIRASVDQFFPGDYTKLQSIGNDFVACFCVSNPPYGVGPSPISNPDVFEIDQRNRQDVLFARVERKQGKRKKGNVFDCHDKSSKGKPIDHEYWKKVTRENQSNREPIKNRSAQSVQKTGSTSRTRFRGLD